MSIERVEKQLSTDIPIDISTPKPYLFSYTLLNSNIYKRAFELDEQIFTCGASQKKRLSRSVDLVIESNETITKKSAAVVERLIRYELGLDEDISILKKYGREDRAYRRSLSIYPGFRLFANHNIHEAALLTIISQNARFPDYLKVTDRLYRKYGKKVPWDKKLRLFPDIEEICKLDVSDWKSLEAMMQAKYLGKLTLESFENIETYTYYPDYDRGLKGLMEIPGIASYSARILMVYGARRYKKALYNQNIIEMLESRLNLSFASIYSFDNWVEKTHPVQPALVMHTLILDHLPNYILDFDFENLKDKSRKKT